MDEKQSPPHTAHRERLRNKLAKSPDVLTDHEVLETVLFGAIPRRNTNPIAHDLLDTFGSLYRVVTAEEDDLIRIKGMTRAAAVSLSAFGELYLRTHRTCENSFCIKTFSDAAWLIQKRYGFSAAPFFGVIILSADFQVVFHQELSCPLAKAHAADFHHILSAYPRHNVFICRVDTRADALTTTQDESLFSELKETAPALSVQILDYMILGTHNDVFSLMRRSVCQSTY